MSRPRAAPEGCPRRCQTAASLQALPALALHTRLQINELPLCVPAAPQPIRQSGHGNVKAAKRLAQLPRQSDMFCQEKCQMQVLHLSGADVGRAWVHG